MIRNALVCFALILLGSQSTYAQTAQSAPQSSPAPGGEPPKDNPPAASQPAKPVDFKSGKAALALPPEKAQPVHLPRFDKPPVIDGKLDDEIWKHAVVLKDFIQVQPGDNISPSKPTEVMLGYDAKFLKPFERALPSRRTVKHSSMVPGSVVPARNAFAVSQTLAWLAKERQDIEEQLEWSRRIGYLMKHLLN